MECSHHRFADMVRETIETLCLLLVRHLQQYLVSNASEGLEQSETLADEQNQSVRRSLGRLRAFDPKQLHA